MGNIECAVVLMVGIVAGLILAHVIQGLDKWAGKPSKLDRIKDSESEIEGIKHDVSRITKQTHCINHNFGFSQHIREWVGFMSTSPDRFLFQCSKCDLILDKTLPDLTLKERNALQALGVIEAKKAGKK